jgi:hypothetical protein
LTRFNEATAVPSWKEASKIEQIDAPGFSNPPNPQDLLRDDSIAL